MSNRTLKPLTKELITARAKISDKRNWCQGVAHKHATIWRREQWCAYGALSDNHWGSPQQKALADAAVELFGHINAAYGDPKVVNDMLGHAAVLAMYDQAISASVP